MRKRTRNMESPFIETSFDLFGGSLCLTSCSGPLEAMWVQLKNEEQKSVIFLESPGIHVQPAVRITPSQARELGKALIEYADNHKETK
jgi:hypothetical protein